MEKTRKTQMTALILTLTQMALLVMMRTMRSIPPLEPTPQYTLEIWSRERDQPCWSEYYSGCTLMCRPYTS